MTQQFFADQIGVNVNTLRAYEKGRSLPSSDVLERICLIFDATPEWLLLGKGPIKREESLKQAQIEAISAKQKTTDTRPSPDGESEELRKECRELRKDNRELVKENRQLWKENGDLRVEVEQLKAKAESSQTSPNETQRKAS